jgi:hypothetical protein
MHLHNMIYKKNSRLLAIKPLPLRPSSCHSARLLDLCPTGPPLCRPTGSPLCHAPSPRPTRPQLCRPKDHCPTRSPSYRPTKPHPTGPPNCCSRRPSPHRPTETALHWAPGLLIHQELTMQALLSAACLRMAPHLHRRHRQTELDAKGVTPELPRL